MTRSIEKQFRLTGRFPNDDFIEWILRRATTLSLTGGISRLSNKEIYLTVSGHPILVDAMEVACYLGPIDVSVDLIIEVNQPLPLENRQSPQIIRYFG